VRTMKRARTSSPIDFESLSFEQQQIIAQAASILRVPFGELPSALDDIHKSSRLGNESCHRRIPRTRRRMKGQLEKPKSLDHGATQLGLDRSSGNAEESLRPIDSSTCADTFWGVGAPQWADCLASLVPCQQDQTYQAAQGICCFIFFFF